MVERKRKVFILIDSSVPGWSKSPEQLHSVFYGDVDEIIESWELPNGIYGLSLILSSRQRKSALHSFERVPQDHCDYKWKDVNSHDTMELCHNAFEELFGEEIPDKCFLSIMKIEKVRDEE